MTEGLQTVRVWWTKLAVLTWKEFIQLRRDPVLLLAAAFLFTVNIYMQGSTLSLQLKSAPLLVYDSDRSGASRELVYRFREPYFRFAGTIEDPREGLRQLDEGLALAVLDIPEGFEDSLIAGRPAALQLQVDTTPTAQAFLASSYAARIVGEYGQELARGKAGFTGSSEAEMPVIRAEPRVWFNPNQEDRWFFPITELLEAITLMSILLPGAALVREKQRGTVEQLLVAPLSPLQIMLPKVIAMTIVTLAGVSISLFTIALPVFDIPVRGSLFLFYIVTGLYVFTNAGLGLLAATIARNVAQMGLLAILMLVPLILISGVWTPPEAMPAWMKAATYVSPMRHYIDLSFGILVKGSGLNLLWDSVLAIAVVGGVVLGFGVWRFRRQLD